MQFFICSSYLLVINNDIGYDIIVQFAHTRQKYYEIRNRYQPTELTMNEPYSLEMMRDILEN